MSPVVTSHNIWTSLQEHLLEKILIRVPLPQAVITVAAFFLLATYKRMESTNKRQYTCINKHYAIFRKQSASLYFSMMACKIQAGRAKYVGRKPTCYSDVEGVEWSGKASGFLHPFLCGCLQIPMIRLRVRAQLNQKN